MDSQITLALRLYLFTFLSLFSFIAMVQKTSGNLKSYAFRLSPHQDVKQSLMKFAKEKKIKAGCILSAVGSLESFTLRFANAQSGTQKQGHFEIMSLTGTFSERSCHLHMSLSDSTGQTFGGHLLDNNLVYTTLELVIGELTDVTFEREPDSTYGYPELIVKPRSRSKDE